MSEKKLQAGDRVTYKEFSLSLSYRGTIISMRGGDHGKDCEVEWTRPLQLTCLDWLDNLKRVEE